MTNLSIKTAGVSDKGLNPKYKVNEDSTLIMERERFFAVADGVGGGDHGDIASRAALKIIANAILKFSQNAGVDRIDFMLKLIQAGNDAVFQIGRKMEKNLASTIAIMSVEKDFAVIGHVGDSRIYLIRGSQLLQLTKDHSKLQELLDENPQLNLTRKEYADGHVITRALGVEEEVKPDIQKILLKDKDLFIICSDGIYTHNSDNDLLNCVAGNNRDLESACAALKKNCYDRGARDNLTAVLIKINLT